jgi:hypothetical protein
MTLKFERVGHGIYVLNGDHCVGRLKQRYSGEWAYCSLNAEEPLSFDQMGEIYQFIQELKTMNPWDYKELEDFFKRINERNKVE